MPAPSTVRVYAFRYVVLGLLFLFSVVHFARDAADVIDTVRHANEYVREPFQPLGQRRSPRGLYGRENLQLRYFCGIFRP